MTGRQNTRIPTRQQFVRAILESVFPNKQDSKTGYSYARACRASAIELGLLSSDFEEEPMVDQDSKLYSLLSTMDTATKGIHNRREAVDLLKNDNYRHYSTTLATFCDEQNGSLANWLSSKTGYIRNGFETALFFSYLLLSRQECAPYLAELTHYCLEALGCTEFERCIADDYEKREMLIGQSGNSKKLIASKADIVMVVGIEVLAEVVGRPYSSEQAEMVNRAHAFIRELLKPEMSVLDSMDVAERRLAHYLEAFEPRSITSPSSTWTPFDFFVMPRFTNLDGNGASPLSGIEKANQSKRSLIVARTGLGKSMYMQIATLCLLDSSRLKDSSREAIAKCQEELDLPRDGYYVLNIPARMFTFCLRNIRYRHWTEDFVTLYFNCIWKLKCSSFYKPDSANNLGESLDVSAEFEVNDLLRNRLKKLAVDGRLVLLLDSYDEIPSGTPRNEYLKALAAFYDSYCEFPESGFVGAHVVITSREMSPQTMMDLREAIEVSARDQFGIEPLNEKQQRELILNWKYKLDGDAAEVETDELVSLISQNHYLQEYAVNPYMLSVVCYERSLNLNRITQSYITALVARMKRNSRHDSVVQGVLRGVEDLLQKIAVETIVSERRIIPRRTINGYIRRRISSAELSEEEIKSYIAQLHEVFVSEVGLIVPADGDDEGYQFINDPIRFELAARGIQSEFDNEERERLYRDELLPAIANLNEYVGLIIPLLCDIGTENIKLSESLVFDLAMHDSLSETDEQILLQGLLDLLLDRYSISLVSLANPGDRDRSAVRKAQRIVLMRLFTSNEFQPTDDEISLITESAAYKKNSMRIAPHVIKPYLDRINPESGSC